MFPPDSFLEVSFFLRKGRIAEVNISDIHIFPSSSKMSHSCTSSVLYSFGDLSSFQWLSPNQRHVNALQEVFERLRTNIACNNSVMLCLRHHYTEPGLLNEEHSWLAALHFLKRVTCSARL